MPRKGFRVPPPGWGSKPLGWNRPSAIESTGTDNSKQFDELLKATYEAWKTIEMLPPLTPSREARNAFISVFSIQYSVISESVSYRIEFDNNTISNREHIEYKWNSSNGMDLDAGYGAPIRLYDLDPHAGLF